MEYTGCCNDKMQERYGRAASLVQALAIVAGHAFALGLILVPIIVPILFKAWIEHERGIAPSAALIAPSEPPKGDQAQATKISP